MDITGTTCGRITDPGELVTPTKYKPFVEFWIESPRPTTQYTDRLRCVIYPGNRTPEEIINGLTIGRLVFVSGDLRGEAYQSSKTPGKWYGGLKMTVRYHIFLDAPEWSGSVDDSRGEAPPPSSPAPAPAPSQPRSETDDVPF